MLKIVIPSREFVNSETYEIKEIKGQTIQLEHSLISLSKWESKWKKPFLNQKEPRTVAETIDYVRCMTLTQNVNPLVYHSIDNTIMERINTYINDPMTATTFSKAQKARGGINREIVTSELIYYWMISLEIPFECQKWHLNRLLTLIEVCNIKSTPAKKMSRREQAREWAAINAARRSKLGSKG